MITVRINEKHSSLLAVSFPEDTVANHLIREIPGRRWSYTRRCWLVPNTRAAVVQVGKLVGKDCCNFDEAIVRLYKPTATAVEVEQATNPPWPLVNRRVAGCRFAMLRAWGSMTNIRLLSRYHVIAC